MKTSAMPLMAESALRGYLGPRLAADAKLDLKPIVVKLTGANYKTSKPQLKLALDAAITPKLAKDASIQDLTSLLDNLDDVAEEVKEKLDDDDDDDSLATDDDGDMMARLQDILQAKGMPDDEISEVMAAMKPEVTEPPADGKGNPPPAQDDTVVTPPSKTSKVKGQPVVTKPAMDAAIKLATDKAVQATMSRMRAIRDAEEAVRPYIGKIVVAQDSAAAVFKLALEANGVKTDGVHESAFPAMLALVPKPGDKAPQHNARVAMDSAADKDFNTRFPGVAQLKHR